MVASIVWTRSFNSKMQFTNGRVKFDKYHFKIFLTKHNNNEGKPGMLSSKYISLTKYDNCDFDFYEIVQVIAWISGSLEYSN